MDEFGKEKKVINNSLPPMYRVKGSQFSLSAGKLNLQHDIINSLNAHVYMFCV